MLSHIFQNKELGNTDWHVEADKNVPVETQQNKVDDAADVTLGVSDGRKNGDDDEVMQDTTT